MKKILAFMLLFIISSNITFAEKTKKDDCYYKIITTSEWKNVYELVLSEKTNSYALITDWKNDWYILEKDGQVTKEYPHYIESINYSPDWKSINFVSNDENWNEYLVEDLDEGNIYDYIQDVEYTPDGKKYAYIVGLLDWKEWKLRAIIKDWKEYLYWDFHWIVYSKDWEELRYIEGEYNYDIWEKKNYIFKDGEKTRLINDDEIVRAKWSPNREDYYIEFLDSEDNKYLYINGNITEKYEYIDNFIYSPDWKSYTYVAKKSEGIYVVVKDWEEIRKSTRAPNIKYIKNGDNYTLISYYPPINWDFIETSEPIKNNNIPLFLEDMEFITYDYKKISEEFVEIMWKQYFVEYLCWEQDLEYDEPFNYSQEYYIEEEDDYYEYEDDYYYEEDYEYEDYSEDLGDFLHWIKGIYTKIAEIDNKIMWPIREKVYSFFEYIANLFK